MKAAPCKTCENKGCGSYHDECEAYQEYVQYLNDIRNNSRNQNICHKLEYVKDDTFRSRSNNLFLNRRKG